MQTRNYLACDLGAESGRVMLGSVSAGQINLEQLHRFPNEPVRLPTGLYWDALRLFHEIQHGLRVAGRERRLAISGIGVDTWGVDFGLLRDGALVDNPRHYRDSRTNGVMERTFAMVPRDQVFAETGIQFMQLNSLFQLHAAKLSGSAALDCADSLLFMPDLFNYWLTGVQAAELTIASTSQFYNPRSRTWATSLLERLGIPTQILPSIVEPGKRLGNLTEHVSDATGLADTPVFATAGHDTASAVAAVPAAERGFCYISSGTWSLMGLELDTPLIDERSLAENFTNEVGVGGRIRFLKNIAGLWLLQECRRAWASEGHNYTYDELSKLAESSSPYEGYIDPDQFLEPGHMPEKIAKWCGEHGQPVPESHAAMARAILESLAQRYDQVLRCLESLNGRTIPVIHIVGGGSRNRLLNQLVANRTGKRVLAGPTEATALGNVLVQAMGDGLIGSLEEGRALIGRSFPIETYEPLQ